MSREPSSSSGPVPPSGRSLGLLQGTEIAEAVGLLARAFRRSGVLTAEAWPAVALAAAYGLVLELLQLAVDGRGWEVGDLLAGVAGAVLWSVYRRLFRPRR